MARASSIDKARQRIDQQLNNTLDDWCSSVTTSANEQLGPLRVLVMGGRKKIPARDAALCPVNPMGIKDVARWAANAKALIRRSEHPT
jgi:hypothetical protein